MHCSLFFCEHAATRADGKLDVRGIYNELYASGFPATQDRVVLAGVVEWDRDAGGEQPFVIHLLGPDRKTIFTIEGRSEIDARAATRPPARTHLIFPLENLVFTTPGAYQSRIEIHGAQISGPSLHVLHAVPEEARADDL